MVPHSRMSALSIEEGKTEITKKIIDEGFSRFPVFLGDINHIIGIVHSKDMLKSVIGDGYRSLKDIMRPVHFVPETMKINELLRDFQRHHIQMAIVTDEFGSTSGLVTMEDIIEELVGEIQDEHDEEKPNVEKKSETEFVINGHTSIQELNHVLPIAIPESPQYETVSGYINFIFGRIPAENDKRLKGGYEFTILKRNPQNIESVRLLVKE